jgi:hypothetical protein
MSKKAPRCRGCGAALEPNLRIARLQSSGRGDPETPELCWVCARLHHSALQEVAQDRKNFHDA